MWWNDIKELKNSVNEMNGRLGRLENTLLELEYKNSRDAIDFAAAIGNIKDKFDNYMKNIDKLNLLVNEFKGCVSIVRACLHDKKEQDDKPKKKHRVVRKPPNQHVT